MAVEEGLDTGGVYARAEIDDPPTRPPTSSRSELGRRSAPTCCRRPARPASATPRPRRASPPTPTRSTPRNGSLDWDRPGRRARPRRPARRRLDHVPRHRFKVHAARRGRRRGAGEPGRARRRPGRHRRRAARAARGPARGQARDGRPPTGPTAPSLPRRALGDGVARGTDAEAAAGPAERARQPGVAARRVAVDALVRIERDGAYANLAARRLLERIRPRPARPGASSPSSSTAPPACGGRATAWSTGSSCGDLDPDGARRRCGSAPTSSPSSAPRPTPRCRPRSAVPRKARGLVNAVLRKVADGRGRLAVRCRRG